MRSLHFSAFIVLAAALQTVCTFAEDAALAPVPAVLDLETAQRAALAANPSLGAAEARIGQAKARIAQARSLFFPQVVAQTTLSKTELSEDQLKASKAAVLAGQVQSLTSQIQYLAFSGNIGGNPLSILTPVANWGIQTYGLLDIDESTEQYGVRIGATWLLFDGFEREFTYRAAQFGRKETEASLRETQRMLLNAVAATYYRAQFSYENIIITHADEDFNKRLLKEAEARQRVGTGPLSDVLNFEVQLNSARAQRIEAERDYRLALIGLAELMGIPDAAIHEDQLLEELAAERPEEMTLPDVDALLVTAKEMRPDLEQSGYSVKRAGANVNAQRGDFYPEVTASASRDAIRTDDYDFDRSNFSTTFGLTMTYTFFAGGRNFATLREAKAFKLESEFSHASLELQVASDVRTAAANLRAAQESLMLQRKNAELVKRNRDLVEKGYVAGQEGLVRLTQSERDYIAARVRLALSLASLKAAWHDLRTATGETLLIAENW